MSGGIIGFVLGTMVGGGVAVLNQRMVDLRTEKLARENQRLQEKLHRDRVEFERGRAYRMGFYEGCKEKSNGEGGRTDGQGTEGEEAVRG